MCTWRGRWPGRTGRWRGPRTISGRPRRCGRGWRPGTGWAGPTAGTVTSTRRPERAETEKATRQGRGETERDTLRRLVRSAAAAAESPAGFRAELGAAGVRFTPRMSTQQPGEVTGYKVSLLPSVSTETTVWFAGGQLDRDLTWPKLTGRWDTKTAADTGPSGAVAAAPPVGDGAFERAQAARGAGVAAGDAATAVLTDPGAVDEIAPAAADLAAAAAGMWERRPDGRRPVAGFTRAGDLAQRAGRRPHPHPDSQRLADRRTARSAVDRAAGP